MPAIKNTQNEVFVFDSALPELQTLINAVGPDQRIIILDNNSDGVLQLASALASCITPSLLWSRMMMRWSGPTALMSVCSSGRAESNTNTSFFAIFVAGMCRSLI